MTPSHKTPCFLFDNGSLKAAATINLRKIAADLELQIGATVQPVSLLHSSGVDSGALGGVPARLLEPSLQVYFSKHRDAEVVLLPLFFGLSAALTDYVPQRLAALRQPFPAARPLLAEPLNPEPDRADPRLVQALAARFGAVVAERGLARPRAILVDHGSPQKRVAQVRDALGAALGEALGERASGVHVASMERRPEPEYAFNDPLLEHRLREAPCNRGDVVVLLQFLSPGRHAGPNGDIATICAAAEKECPELRTHISDTIGSAPEIVTILAERYEACVAANAPRAPRS